MPPRQLANWIRSLTILLTGFFPSVALTEEPGTGEPRPVQLVPAEPCPEPAPPKPAPKPYKTLFYENDFRYLDDPNHPHHLPFDFLKRVPIDCLGDPGDLGDLLIDLGGEFRWQGKSENNRRLDGRNNTYNLFRERVYLDARYDNRVRVYVEGIDAVSFNEDQPPLIIDENRTDLINLFGEVRLWSEGDRSLSLRGGRQELLFGAQRLVSPLDWGNTRRTFDDVARLVYRSQEWDLDGFWGRPIVADVHNFDHGDQSRQFGGAYAVYKGVKDQIIDLYFLTLLESDDLVLGRRGVRGDFEVYTFGSRWFGSRNDWLWEFEGAYQFGNQANLDRSAGMVTGGIGRRFPKAWAKPEIWFYYDWASGDSDPNDDEFSTFNQLFPLAHPYFGFLDLVARQNIRDPNVRLALNPHQRLKLTAWYHRFMLDEPRDALFNAAGAVSRRDPTGRAGDDVGDEIDLMLDILLSTNADIQIGYSHFTPGGFIQRTGIGGDAEFFYTQFVFRF